MFLLVERGPGPEQGMPPVQSQRKASTEIDRRRKANVVRFIEPPAAVQTQARTGVCAPAGARPARAERGSAGSRAGRQAGHLLSSGSEQRARRAGHGPQRGSRAGRASRGRAGRTALRAGQPGRTRGSAAGGGGGGGRPAVKLSVSKIQTQRHQIRLNPSPNESKSRTRSAVGRFKPQFELPNGFQMGRAYSRIERLDETNPSSPRSLNSDIIKTSKCPLNGGPREEEEEKRRRKGGKKLLLDHRLASKQGQSSPRPPSNAGSPPGLQVTPDFRPAYK
ncbi:hypothetical protein M5K25_006607 [Dendrobium thyrsiflorum]|uniref:Uncharacterized protein n=1 Tax=Dendrobium thyrsiflorum TaxID=117978 RepID=A0ABD0VBJ2_DENTH